VAEYLSVAISKLRCEIQVEGWENCKEMEKGSGTRGPGLIDLL